MEEQTTNQEPSGEDTAAPALKIRRRCVDCNYTQDVTPSTSVVDSEGKTRQTLDDTFDFCKRCDGEMMTVDSIEGQ
jgi:Pyruvate/2-oxoacid:ferredoxin oxidoreductase delta subunit